jgi:hypothetical protein
VREIVFEQYEEYAVVRELVGTLEEEVGGGRRGEEVETSFHGDRLV